MFWAEVWLLGEVDPICVGQGESCQLGPRGCVQAVYSTPPVCSCFELHWHF